MQKIEQHTLDFLRDLSENNNREWFNDNKPRYEKAKKNFEAFAQTKVLETASMDIQKKIT